MAAVAHCTAVDTSLPEERALKAPCAAAWQALAGAPPLGENHVGVPGSAASGTLGAQAGTWTGGAEPALGACVAGSAAPVGAHIGRGGGPDWAGETGPGWLGCTACDGGVGAGAGAG